MLIRLAWINAAREPVLCFVLFVFLFRASPPAPLLFFYTLTPTKKPVPRLRFFGKLTFILTMLTCI